MGKQKKQAKLEEAKNKTNPISEVIEEAAAPADTDEKDKTGQQMENGENQRHRTKIQRMEPNRGDQMEVAELKMPDKY